MDVKFSKITLWETINCELNFFLLGLQVNFEDKKLKSLLGVVEIRVKGSFSKFSINLFLALGKVLKKASYFC